jgi:D-aminopeptidase
MTKTHLTVRVDEATIDSIFAYLNRTDQPGAAVGVSVNSSPKYRKCFGLANMELPMVLSPSVRIRISSMTKHFTCLAYLLLCEDGRATVDDLVGDHLHDVHPVSRKVSMRQLMGNVGGLRDAHGMHWAFSGVRAPATSAELMDYYVYNTEAEFPPGTFYKYSNGGFLLTTAVIERITGQTLEQVLRERIFEPVGMYDTLLRRTDSDFVSNSAAQHARDGRGGFKKIYRGCDLAGEGGVVSTLDDMLRWLAHMDAPRIGKDKTWKTLLEPTRFENGESTSYGMGLHVDTFRGLQTIHHGGGNSGSNSAMVKVIDAKLDIVILMNRRDGTVGEAPSLAEAIVEACLPVAEARHVKRVFERKFIGGVFKGSATDRLFEFYEKDGEQVLETTHPMILEQVGKSSWRPAGIGITDAAQLLVACPETADIPSTISIRECGVVEEFRRLESDSCSDVEGIEGRYSSAVARCEATILRGKDGLNIKLSGALGTVCHHLRPIAKNVWRALASPSIGWDGGLVAFDVSGRSFQYSHSLVFPVTFHRLDK